MPRRDKKITISMTSEELDILNTLSKEYYHLPPSFMICTLMREKLSQITRQNMEEEDRNFVDALLKSG